MVCPAVDLLNNIPSDGSLSDPVLSCEEESDTIPTKTIEDQLSIVREARVARQQASRELSYMEQELRWALSAAKVNQQAPKSFA